MYDIELSSDRFELEQAYRMDCALESAYEAGRADATLTFLEQQVKDILERQDIQLQALEQFKQDLGVLDRAARLEQNGTFRACSPSGPVRQTEEETKMFEEWLS